MFNVKDYNIPIDLLTYVILKHISYFELDSVLPCFRLTPKEIALIKYKIYRARLQIDKRDQAIFYSMEGKEHREDGPAIIRKNGDKEWFINGKHHRDNDLPAIEDATGYKAWYMNGKRHRLNDPAIIYQYERKEWFLNGKLHRLNGPAIEYRNCGGEWWLHGKRHRLDGPAIDWHDSPKKWYLNGQQVPEF